MEARAISRASLVESATAIVAQVLKHHNPENHLAELLAQLGRQLFIEFDFAAARDSTEKFNEQKKKYISAADHLAFLLLEVVLTHKDEKSFVKVLEIFAKALTISQQAHDFFGAKMITLVFGMLPETLLARLSPKSFSKIKKSIEENAKLENQFDEAMLIAKKSDSVVFHLTDFFFKAEFMQNTFAGPTPSLKRHQSNPKLEKRNSKKAKIADEMPRARLATMLNSHYEIFMRLGKSYRQAQLSHPLAGSILFLLSASSSNLMNAVDSPLKKHYDSMLRVHEFVLSLSQIKEKHTIGISDAIITILQDDLREEDRLQQVIGIERYIECENKQSPGLLKRFGMIGDIKDSIQARILLENYIQMTSRKSSDKATEATPAITKSSKHSKRKKSEGKLKRIKSSSSIVANPGSNSHLLSDSSIEPVKRKRANTDEQRLFEGDLPVHVESMLDPLAEENDESDAQLTLSRENVFERKKPSVPVLPLGSILNRRAQYGVSQKISPSKSSPVFNTHSIEAGLKLIDLTPTSGERSAVGHTPRTQISPHSFGKSPRVQSESSVHTPHSITMSPRDVDTPRSVKALRTMFVEKSQSVSSSTAPLSLGKESEKKVLARVTEFEKMLAEKSPGVASVGSHSQSQPVLFARVRRGSAPEHPNTEMQPQRRNTFDNSQHKKSK